MCGGFESLKARQLNMAVVAQLVERQIVVLEVEGSKPFYRPIIFDRWGVAKR